MTRGCFLAFLFASALFAQPASAAVQCALDHPDRDIKRLVPESTSYRVRELIPARHGKKDLLKTLEKELESPLDAEFETADTPYTFYAVYKDKTQVALILGANTRLFTGPAQIFVVYEPKGKIRDVYFQKIASSDAAYFRSKYYRQQYRKFGLNDALEDALVLPPVRLPSPETLRDEQAVVRAVRLNILLVRHLYNEFKE